MRASWMALLALVGLAAAGRAQTLTQRITTLGEGTLRLSFAARAGVCGSGGHSITVMDEDESGEWESDCEPGPVRVSIRVHEGRLAGANTYVGGRWRDGSGRTVDLGTMPARQAATELLDLAEGSRTDAEDLVTAATLADSATVWPRLLRMARRTELPLETRRHAVFWLGQAAGKAATKGLDSLVQEERGDLEVRKQAVFALSQRPSDEGVPALIHIARTNPHPEIRKSALFWLGQSEDPRAISLFEEILK